MPRTESRPPQGGRQNQGPRPPGPNQGNQGRPQGQQQGNPNAVGKTQEEYEAEQLGRLQRMLQERREQLVGLLAGTIDPDRFITVAIMAVQTQPGLLRCSPLSILAAIREAAALGLELGGVVGDAALVPYAGIATMQPQYRGLRRLALRSGDVKAVAADLVYEKDTFRIVSGTDPKIVHEPAFPDRGGVLGGYAWARLENGELLHLEMTNAELLKRRDASKAYQRAERSGANDSPWHLWPQEQMRKTLVKRLCNEQLPLTPVARDALNRDTEIELAEKPSALIGSEAQRRILQAHGLGIGETDVEADAERAFRARPVEPEADAASSAGASDGASAGVVAAPSGGEAPPAVQSPVVAEAPEAASPPDSAQDGPEAPPDADIGAPAPDSPATALLCASPSPWVEPPATSTCTKELGHRLVCSDGQATWETPKGWVEQRRAEAAG